MTLSITLDEMRAYSACNHDDRVAGLVAHLGRMPGDDEPIPLRTWADVAWVERDEDGETCHAEHSARDLMWALRCCWARGGRAVGVEVACRAAERALVHARQDDVPALRAAIGAARGYVAGTTTRAALPDAARAADAAADAAYAIYAAAHAAHAAAYAIYAAADAAYAAAYVICAADVAADAAADADAERARQRADLIELLEAP